MAQLGSQRHTKLTSAEAALLAGELKKPSWESRNEGIHERVSFEDSIWGFDLAGGSFYKTPLRVTAVKKDSRAQKAGIRPGDKLLRINDIDTSTLTIQEAHAMIIESGIHIRLAVSAPDDVEDSYHCWEDPIEEARLLEEQRLKEKEEERLRQIHCRTRADWSLEWPWVSKRRIIYKESNCYMVPSKYEGKHRDKFPVGMPCLKQEEDIVLHSKKSKTPTSTPKEFEFPKSTNNSQVRTNPAENAKQNGAIDMRNDIKGVKLPVPPTIPEENLNDEIINEDNIKNGKEKLKETPMEVEYDAVLKAESESQSVEEIEEKVKITTQDDKELEDWNPNENDSSMEENANDYALEEMTNGQEEILEEEQNKILDEVLNEKIAVHETYEDIEGETSEGHLDEFINGEEEIEEEPNQVLDELSNGDIDESETLIDSTENET